MQQSDLLKDMLMVYGSVIVFLLSIIAWTLKRFVDGYDNFKKEATEQLQDHETRIAILEQ